MNQLTYSQAKSSNNYYLINISDKTKKVCDIAYDACNDEDYNTNIDVETRTQEIYINDKEEHNEELANIDNVLLLNKKRTQNQINYANKLVNCLGSNSVIDNTNFNNNRRANWHIWNYTLRDNYNKHNTINTEIINNNANIFSNVNRVPLLYYNQLIYPDKIIEELINYKKHILSKNIINNVYSTDRMNKINLELNEFNNDKVKNSTKKCVLVNEELNKQVNNDKLNLSKTLSNNLSVKNTNRITLSNLFKSIYLGK